MNEETEKDKLIKEIEKREDEFCRYASEKGIGEAFIHFAADDALINRNNRIYKGKKEIKDFYSGSDLSDAVLTWAPDFIDVAAAGDLAWTYGKYEYRAKSHDGKEQTSRGIFHTVWKKQADGTWKYVWD